MQTQVSKQANREARSAQPSRHPYIMVTKRSLSKTSVDVMNALQHRKTTRVPLTPVFANGSRLDHSSSTLPNKAPPSRLQWRPSTGVGFNNAPWWFLRRRDGWDAASLQCIRVNSDSSMVANSLLRNRPEGSLKRSDNFCRGAAPVSCGKSAETIEHILLACRNIHPEVNAH